MNKLDFSTWSFPISITALLITGWGRVEAFMLNNRTRRLELIRKVGDALVAAQFLRNKLEQEANLVEKYLNYAKTQKINILVIGAFKDSLLKLENEKEEFLSYIQAFEKLIILFEGGIKVSIDQGNVEAKIAHFNQRRVLAEGDLQYVESKIQQLKDSEESSKSI